MNIKGKKLGEVQGKSCNLHMIRFIASIMVIISHSFPISMGENGKEIISKITKDELSLGGIAVLIFFLAGGYLIAKSMERLETFKAYFTTRIIRIFPLLIVVILLTMFVMGPVVTTLSFKKYFTNPLFFKYALNGIFILQHNLPGVFELNLYGTTVNGALWTLPVEFMCYIVCYIFYKIKLMKQKTAIYTIPIAIVAYFILYYIFVRYNMQLLLSAIKPCMLFYIGMLYYIYRDKIILNGKLALIAGVMFIVSIFIGGTPITILVAFPYMCMYLFFGAKQRFEKLSDMGNYSYGIYLCGFPIQQVIVNYMGHKMNPYINMIIAVPIAIAFAIILYYLVEKPVNEIGRNRCKIKKSKNSRKHLNDY